MMPDIAKVTGVVKIFEESMSFALPIFSLPGERDNLMQEIDEKGCIAGFVQIDISDLQVFSISADIKRRIGELAIYAFEVEPECFHVDEKGGLTPIVQRAL